MRRTVHVNAVVLAGFLFFAPAVPTHAADATTAAQPAKEAQHLQHPTQEENPSLDETLSWLAQRINSINSGAFEERTVKLTTIKIDGSYNFRYTQSVSYETNEVVSTTDSIAGAFLTVPEEVTRTNEEILNVDGNLSSLTSAAVTTASDAEIHVLFATKVHTYLNNDPNSSSNYVQSFVIHTSDLALAEKIAKGFNHAANLFAKMPKRDDLF